MRQSSTKRGKLSAQRAFGLAVRARRVKLGYSQEALADVAQLHRTYLGSVERGERNVSLRNIFAIASALRIDPSELIVDAESRSTG
jgi:transcriptional regulator with XRE-family HTH domain